MSLKRLLPKHREVRQEGWRRMGRTRKAARRGSRCTPNLHGCARQWRAACRIGREAALRQRRRRRRRGKRGLSSLNVPPKKPGFPSGTGGRSDLAGEKPADPTFVERCRGQCQRGHEWTAARSRHHSCDAPAAGAGRWTRPDSGTLKNWPATFESTEPIRVRKNKTLRSRARL